MTVTDWILLATMIVMVISVGVSIWAVKITRSIQERLAQLEEEKEGERKHEKKKAFLVAEMSNKKLYINNQSQNQARDVEILIDEKPIMEHAIIPGNETEKKTIGPLSKISYITAVTFGNWGPWKIRINWSDDSREPGEWEGMLP